MTRPFTPPLALHNGTTRLRVKRTCNNCYRILGDATDDELAAAVVDEPLPDTTDECGCARIIEQLALLSNHVDQQESGTATWEQLDPAGREAYLKEAVTAVRALVHLGWGPAPELTTEVIDRAAGAAWASTGPSVANGFGDAEAWADADVDQRNRWRQRAAAAIAESRSAVTA
ncbi:hypothetical protein CH252_19010 [Rhodococcus sp. 06-1477-1B]|nr:hypothetical protein CH252_19010 [Rhodococcus sp. 06-1477-1B]